MIESEFKNEKITVAQAIALHKVFARAPIYRRIGEADDRLGPSTTKEVEGQESLTFEEFVKHYVQNGTDCVMAHWCGMWLGIETDGYTHS